MKKILLINSRLSSGGSEKVMSIIANYLSLNNYDVTMLLLRSPYENNYYIEKSVKIIQFEDTSKFKLIKLIKRLFWLRKQINIINPNTIISFMVDINAMTMIACPRKFKKRVILSERADPESESRKKIHKLIETCLYKKAKLVVTQTDLVQEYFTNKKILNTTVIPNPVLDNKNAVYWQMCKCKKKIISIGRLTNQKNFYLLINVVKKVFDKFPDYICEIYGEGPLKDELDKLIKSLKMENKIFLKGFVNDIDKKIIESNIYVSSSNYEGISNSMLESLTYGVPTICTDCRVGGARMVIKDHINGILVPVNDEKKLYDSIIEVLNDKTLQKKISENGKKIINEYSIKKIGKDWEKIL